MSVKKIDAQHLASMALFGAVEDGVLNLLLADAHWRHCQPGEFFFKEHDEGSSVFVLLEGTALGIKQSEEFSFVFRHYQPGDCFGEMAFIDLNPRAVSCVAATEAIALEFERLSLLALYRANPAQYAVIQMNLAREISRRLRSVDAALFEHLASVLERGENLPQRVSPYGVI